MQDGIFLFHLQKLRNKFHSRSAHGYKIACGEPELIPTCSTVSRTVKRQSCIARFSTFSTTAAFVVFQNAGHSLPKCANAFESESTP
ncbi:hypothetical protein TNCV_4615551 [Trichonephila clavipes]|nr:hypothetical protein TNCV_4615551 [Trichonephila clavipes]